MIRVKIRCDQRLLPAGGAPSGKVLRVDPSVPFPALLQKIAAKLGVAVARGPIESQYTLLLGDTGGERIVLEDASEVDHNDDLVLTKAAPPTVDDRTCANAEFSAPPAEMGNSSVDGAAESDSFVEDATDDVLEQRRKKHKAAEVINLLSDDKDETVCESDDNDDDGSVEEGSDAWESEEPSSSEEDSDFELDKKPAAKKRRRVTAKTQKPPPETPLQVLMEEKDVPAAPGKRAEKEKEEEKAFGLDEVSTLVDGAGRKKADHHVRDRIIKLLNTGFHNQSNENEAKNAMKLAQRLMKKHNLSQALLLKEREAKNKGTTQEAGEILKGGMVHVQIVNRKTGKPALFARWLSNLVHPVTKNFDVKSYYTTKRGLKCQVTFYGIYTNAQLAAYAFRLATERISQMMAEFQPEKQTFWWGSKNISTKSSRLSYAIGIVKGISEDVKRNIKAEEEKRLHKLQRARLAVSKGEAYEESDSEDDGLENGVDVDGDEDKDGPGFSFAIPPDEVSSKASNNGTSADSVDVAGKNDQTASSVSPAKPKAVSGEELGNRLQELEQENQAALVLVNHHEKVAEDVLKDNGIKLVSSRKRKAINFDGRSYRKGIEDAKEIDLNQRAIRHEVKVKKEEN